MRRIVLALFLVCLMASVSYGVTTGGALLCEQTTVDNTVGGVTFTTAGTHLYTVTNTLGGTALATWAICSPSQPINILFDGTAPTASFGIPVVANGTFTLYNNNDLVHFLAIRTTGSSATMTCCYGN